MKKMLSFVAIIAIATTTLAFSPVEKNDALDNAIVSSELNAPAAGVCVQNYETATTFSKCDKYWVEFEQAQLAEQALVLENF